jgi:MFS family permease
MTRSAGYLELLRGNRDYRRLWIGDMASLLGDWFNTIALYTLIRQLTGSPVALGLVFIVKTLPFALASPLAGLLADRFDRKRLMIGADVARAVVVLGFLAVDRAAELPLLYGLIALQMMIGAVFTPARSASLPNITTPRELLTANALSAATWSVLLAVGAALGGFATEGLGTGTVFMLDSASYLISAVFVAGVRIPPLDAADEPAPDRPAAMALHIGRRLAESWRQAHDEIVDGWRQLTRRPEIGRMALVKPIWAVGGGALVYALTLVGESWRPGAPAVGIGLLFAARGLGTGIGPIAARAGVPERHWPTMFGLGLVMTGLAYMTVGWMAWGLWLPLLVVVAHAPSGANWVASTVLLQKRTPDRYRGRVFATEWLLITLIDSAAILAVSVLLQTAAVTLRQAILAFAALEIAGGIAWLAAVVPPEKRLQAAEPAEAPTEVGVGVQGQGTPR